MELKKYYPYKSIDRPTKKFYIITNDNKKVYFGATGYEHFTEGHLDDRRKWAYIWRHKNSKKEDWGDPNTAGFWSYWFLWQYRTYEEAYRKIRKDLKDKGYL
jgi:hypothetical protein